MENFVPFFFLGCLAIIIICCLAIVVAQTYRDIKKILKNE